MNKATLDQKYSFMHDRAVSYSKELHKNTMTATENKGMAAFTKEYEASYNAAYGVKNDIAKRVTEYNNSQQAGAAIVKNGVILVGSVAAGVLTGGAGLALFPTIMATGATTAAVTATAEFTDRLTSGYVTQGLKNGGLTGALTGAKEALPKEKMEEILKSAGINGATAIAGGLAGTGIEVGSQTLKIGKGLKTIAFVSSDIGIGAGAEYAQTRTVTIQGIAFSAILSATGQIVALKKLGKIEEAKTAKVQEVAAHSETTLPLVANAESAANPFGHSANNEANIFKSNTEGLTPGVDVNKYSVSKATEADLKEIHKIDLEAFAKTDPVANNFASYKADIEGQGLESHVIKSEDGKVVGYYQLEPMKNGELYIYSIGVPKELRNTKSSFAALSKMQESIKQIAAEKGATKVTLHVNAEDARHRSKLL